MSDNICSIVVSSLPSVVQENIRQAEKPKPTPSEIAVSLLVFFNSSLQKNIPEVGELCKPTTAIHFDALLKAYNPDEIKQVITFSHTGWWAKHVHSPKYLRDKFTKLLAAFRREDVMPSKGINYLKVDRRTLNIDGTPMKSKLEGSF